MSEFGPPSTTTAERPSPTSGDTVVDAATVAEINAALATVEVPTSKAAERLRNTTERVAGFLDKRAAKQPERQIARADRVDKVKGFFSKITDSGLIFLESQGIIPLRSTWPQQHGLIAKYVGRRRDAKRRKTERASGAGFLSAEQAAAVGIKTQPSEPEVEPVINDVETAVLPTTETTDRPADTTETAEQNTEETEPTDETQANPDIEVAVAETRAERARARREDRRARRAEKRANRGENNERSEGLKQRVFAAARKIGASAIGTIFKRAKAAGSAAVHAGASAWKNFGS